MKRVACLALVLFWAHLFVSGSYGEGSPEFFEYESIVLTPFSDPFDISIPNWRELYLAKIAKYENFLKKYPNSPLIAEAKLRIAELSFDVEREEVYSLRVKMYECLAEHGGVAPENVLAREECIRAFHDKTKKWRDSVYVEKAAAILFELVEKYGHQPRYEMQEPRIGGFQWVDEEIGAPALYILSRGADPEQKKKILLLILREYKPGPKLTDFIKKDLEQLKNVK